MRSSFCAGEYHTLSHSLGNCQEVGFLLSWAGTILFTCPTTQNYKAAFRGPEAALPEPEDEVHQAESTLLRFRADCAPLLNRGIKKLLQTAIAETHWLCFISEEKHNQLILLT